MLDYFPFGDERINEHAEDYENDYRFTGKERDTSTGLLYYESRYYNSSLGRFLSIDPWEGDISNPQTLNKYAYVANNPLKYVDPTGEIPILIPLAAAITAYGLNSGGLTGGLENAPITGDMNDVYSAITGQSLYTGKSVSGKERAITAGAAIIPGVNAGGTKFLGNVGAVIKETLENKGNITSDKILTESQILDAGEQFLGDNYKEIGDGVFRGTGEMSNRQFRIDNSSLEGNHHPNTPMLI